MSNVIYALMVRDIGSTVDRLRMDDALAGKVTLSELESDDSIDPTMIEVSPNLPPVPNITDMDKLRETWGRNPSAIREQLKFNDTADTLPIRNPKAN